MPDVRGGDDDHLLMRRTTGQLCENRSRVTGEVTSWGARFRYEGQRRYLTLEAESREEAIREMALLMFALRMALHQRAPGADVSLVAHSDSGSQYTSFDYTQLLDDHDVLGSIGTVGDAYDCDDVRAAVSV
jgi:transposase InsO family protein